MPFENRRSVSEATRALRSACKTLCNTVPEVIRSIDLTIPMADLSMVDLPAVALVERIAAEHGLVTQARIDNHLLLVHLSRRDSPSHPTIAVQHPPEPASISVAGRSPVGLTPQSDFSPISDQSGWSGQAIKGGILLVEDDATLSWLIAANLTRHGLRVREAQTAHDALRAVQDARPDLLILDIDLPDRTGWDVLRELSRRGIAVPTVVTSSSWVNPCRLDEFRPRAYLPKPFPLETLLRLVVGGTPESNAPGRLDGL